MLRVASHHPPGPRRRLRCLVSAKLHYAFRGQRPKALPQSAQYERHCRHKDGRSPGSTTSANQRPSRKFRSPGKLFTREVAVSITPLHPIPIPRTCAFGLPQHEVYKIVQGRWRTGERLMKALDQISAKIYERGFDGSGANVHANRDGFDQKGRCYDLRSQSLCIIRTLCHPSEPSLRQRFRMGLLSARRKRKTSWTSKPAIRTEQA